MKYQTAAVLAVLCASAEAGLWSKTKHVGGHVAHFTKDKVIHNKGKIAHAAVDLVVPKVVPDVLVPVAKDVIEHVRKNAYYVAPKGDWLHDLKHEAQDRLSDKAKEVISHEVDELADQLKDKIDNSHKALKMAHAATLKTGFWGKVKDTGKEAAKIAKDKAEKEAKRVLDEEKQKAMDKVGDREARLDTLTDIIDEHVGDAKKDKARSVVEPLDATIAIQDFQGEDSVANAADSLVDKASHGLLSYDEVEAIVKALN